MNHPAGRAIGIVHLSCAHVFACMDIQRLHANPLMGAGCPLPPSTCYWTAIHRGPLISSANNTLTYRRLPMSI